METPHLDEWLSEASLAPPPYALGHAHEPHLSLVSPARESVAPSEHSVLDAALRAQLDRVIAEVWSAALDRPIHAASLVARLRGLYPESLRVARESLLELGELLIDLSGREVASGGLRVRLTRREFEVLCFLVRREGKVVTRAELLMAVWGQEAAASPRTVDLHVHRLRNKLGAPFATRIQTLRRVGYKLCADPVPVESADD